MRAERIRKVGQALTAVSAVIIAYATLAPGVDAGAADDEFLHFLLFLPLGLGGALWMAALEPAVQKKARLGILLVVLVFAAATEIGQGAVDGREPSFGDFIADAAGAGLGLLIGGLIAARAERAPE